MYEMYGRRRLFAEAVEPFVTLKFIRAQRGD
jgi:hypothetical protein